MISARGNTTESRKIVAIFCALAPVFFLWALCLAFFWPLVTPYEDSRLYFARGDLTDQFFPFRRFIAASLWNGSLPLWNPGMFGGHPALADIQSAFFSPLTLLTILFAGREGLPFYTLQLEILADFCLGGLFMYLFARQIAQRRASALLAALAFTLGGYLTSYPPEQLPILESSIWLPLALYFIQRDMKGQSALSPFPPLGVTLAGMSLGLTILGGHPQTALLSFYTALLYLAYLAWCIGGKPPVYQKTLRTWGPVVLYPAWAAFIGLGVGAVQWLPTAELLGLSTRASTSFAELEGGFPLADLLSLLFPGFVSRYAPLYVGLLPLLTALAALVIPYPHLSPEKMAADRRRPIADRSSSAVVVPAEATSPFDQRKRPWPQRYAAFWAGLALLALLLSFGGNTFLYPLAYLAIPGFNLFRGQERAAFIYSLAVATLAGLGADLLAGSSKTDLSSWKRPAILLAAIMVALLVIFGYTTDRPEGPDVVLLFLRDRTGQLLVILLVSLLLLAARSQGRLSPGVFLGFAILVTAADLFLTNRPVNLSRQDPVTYFQQAPAIRGFLQRETPPFRVRNNKVWPENFGSAWGLASLEGNSPLQIRILPELAKAIDEWRLWQLLDVRYVVTRQDPGTGTRRIMQEGDVGLYQVVEGPPRHAWIVGEARLAHSDAEALTMLGAPDFDPHRHAVIQDATVLPLDGLSGQAQVTVYRPQYIAIEAQAKGRSLLVVSEIFYPGWRARVNGREVPLYRVDYALRGIVLEPGVQRVELFYQPLSFYLGTAISLATWLLSGSLLLWRFLRR